MQGFTLWQQATIEITQQDHLVTISKYNQLYTRFTSSIRSHSPGSLYQDNSIIACS